MKLELVGHQGDVCLFRVTDFPSEERTQDDQTKAKILAYGEASGHCHEVETPSAEVFKILSKAYEGLVFIDAKEKTTIRHGRIKGFTGTETDQDYHTTVELPPGKYVTGIVEETDHMAQVVRRVVD